MIEKMIEISYMTYLEKYILNKILPPKAKKYIFEMIGLVYNGFDWGIVLEFWVFAGATAH